MPVRIPDMRAFVTGSRAYGTPSPHSDIDLVVFVTPADLKLLLALADPQPATGTTGSGGEADKPFDEVGAPLRFGRLNLLCVTDERAYQVWSEGTRHLRTTGRKVSRTEAVAYFRGLRRAAGLMKGGQP